MFDSFLPTPKFVRTAGKCDRAERRTTPALYPAYEYSAHFSGLTRCLRWFRPALCFGHPPKSGPNWRGNRRWGACLLFPKDRTQGRKAATRRVSARRMALSGVISRKNTVPHGFYWLYFGRRYRKCTSHVPLFELGMYIFSPKMYPNTGTGREISQKCT